MANKEIDRKKLDFVHRELLPEVQFLAGLISGSFVLQLLHNSENMPATIQPLIGFIEKIPNHRISMWIVTLIAFVGSVDGARRIIVDQLPFYRAYIQVFLFGQKFEDVDDSGQLGSGEQAEPNKLD